MVVEGEMSYVRREGGLLKHDYGILFLDGQQQLFKYKFITAFLENVIWFVYVYYL